MVDYTSSAGEVQATDQPQESYAHWLERLRGGLQHYAKLGLSVVPAARPLFAVTGDFLQCNCLKGRHCMAPGKHPLPAWKHLGTLSVDEMLDLWVWVGALGYKKVNTALLCGARSRVIVLDVDPRHGGAVEAVAAAGWPLNTWRVVSGSGGEHLYYRMPEQMPRAKSDPKYLKGVELKADGAIVIRPGSLHQSGKLYRWRDGYGPGQRALPEIPDHLLAALAQEQHRAAEKVQHVSAGLLTDRTIPTTPTAPSEPVKLSESELRGLERRAPEFVRRAVQRARAGRDGGRHLTGVWLACQLRDLRVSRAVGRKCMLAYQQEVEALHA
jgi:hypothetical protein